MKITEHAIRDKIDIQIEEQDYKKFKDILIIAGRVVNSHLSVVHDFKKDELANLDTFIRDILTSTQVFFSKC